MRNINSLSYIKLITKFEKGLFTEGKNCSISGFYSDKNISEFPRHLRTPEICVGLMAYSRCDFDNVPKESRTREFFISAFSNKGVYNYIKNNIQNFDREFFKDLIVSNKYSCCFDNNCFEIMPLEYIDEEMCSLAAIFNTDWCNDKWFYSAYNRKPEALTRDLWHFAARTYARMTNKGINKILSITPEEYKGAQYYLEMCRCAFSYGMPAYIKTRIMESFPKDAPLIIWAVLSLLSEDINNISSFSEELLELEVKIDGYKRKVWQHAIVRNGKTIQHLDLNDERIHFFLKNYGKDSTEYRLYFKDKYKEYKRQQEQSEANAKREERIRKNNEEIASRVLKNILRGEDPNKAIQDEIASTPRLNKDFLPIKYNACVPTEYAKEYDQEEYLALVYESYGIQIIEEYDDLFYLVTLPEGFSITGEGYWYDLCDANGEVILNFFYDNKFYDKDAYVSYTELAKDKTLELK